MSEAARVTREDIEAKLGEIRDELAETRERARGTVVVAGIVGVAVLVGAAYWLGRRKGRKRSTVVEVRRV
ncbi:MAG: hypothetical protein C4344_05355 [Acidimicrobiia bacterium]